MKVKKISSILLKNYIVVILIMISTLVVFFLYALLVGWLVSGKSIGKPLPQYAQRLMKDDYREIDGSIMDKYDGWIEIIDKDFNVLYFSGTAHEPKKKYTPSEFYEHIENKNDKYLYSVAYNDEQSFLLITAMPRGKTYKMVLDETGIDLNRLIIISSLVCIVVFIGCILMYAKMTSRNFTIPLQNLMAGVNSLYNGDYNTRIDIRTKNEFEKLGNAFNLLVGKINEEKNLREKSENRRKQLIRDITHDLKTPLSNILGYTQIIKDNNSLTEESRAKYCSTIENNGIRANKLIVDLFDFSVLESIDYNLTKENTDFCEFLRTLIANYLTDMNENKVDYEFEIPETCIYIDLDRTNMERAIGNLITNSIKYNPPNTKLYIGIKELTNSIEIIIQDNGIGVPKELKDTIFEPFVRVDSSRNTKTGGTGLGLSITKTIIEKHGGTINLCSDTGEGCRYVIEIPRHSS